MARKVLDDAFAQRLIGEIQIAEVAATESDEHRVIADPPAHPRRAIVAHAAAVDHSAAEVVEQPIRARVDEEIADVAVHWDVDDRDIGSAGDPRCDCRAQRVRSRGGEGREHEASYPRRCYTTRIARIRRLES